MFKLTQQNALITGATGGIGLAIAKTLASQGANLVLSATNEEKLNTLKDEIMAEFGVDVKCLRCNLSDVNEVESLFDEAEKLFEKIDILVCNAGITRDNLVLRMKNQFYNIVILYKK